MALLGRAQTAEFWTEVRQKACYQGFREKLLKIWREYCEDAPIYALKYSEFKQFFVTGERRKFEKTYFARRLALASSALLAMIWPEEEKYLLRLQDEIFAICNEYTWCLPAHQKPDLQTVNQCQIDLFASETCFALAEIDTLLADRLEPLIRNRIRVEIDRRILTSLRENQFGWEKSTSNWAAVCASSVSCCMMLLFPKAYDEFHVLLEGCIERFLSGFSPEGVCFEGPMYWFYGFGFFTVYADMVRTYTDGALDYFKRDHVRKISSFFQKVFLSGKAYVTFADCDKEAFYHLGLSHRLKREYPEDVEIYMPELSNDFDRCGRFCMYLRSALWYEESFASAAHNTDMEFWAPDAQWLIVRKGAYGFACKGGCNREPHNHNDVGSFVFAKNGKQYVTDPGRGEYTRQYFANETRYDILECSSRGHCVPIIDGAYQKFGGEYTAGAVSYGDGVMSMDIAGAYGLPELTSLRRSFCCGVNSVEMTDMYAYSGSGVLQERLVTTIKPELRAECNTVQIEAVSITYHPEQCTVQISQELRGNGEICYFIDFLLKDSVREFQIVIC